MEHISKAEQDAKMKDHEEYLANLTFGQKYGYLVSFDYWCGIYDSLKLGLTLYAPVFLPVAGAIIVILVALNMGHG